MLIVLAAAAAGDDGDEKSGWSVITNELFIICIVDLFLKMFILSEFN